MKRIVLPNNKHDFFEIYLDLLTFFDSTPTTKKYLAFPLARQRLGQRHIFAQQAKKIFKELEKRGLVQLLPRRGIIFSRKGNYG